jgi:hypothetical protein
MPSVAESASRRPRRPPAQVVLPFTLLVGPYRFSVHLVDRSQLRSKKELCDLDVNVGVVRLAQSLTGARRARYFLKCVIRLVHYASGCQTGCIEEAFTHSLATGLVAFARHNPEAWSWFNLLLSESVRPGAAFDRVARGATQRRFPAPKMLHLQGWTLRVCPLSEASSQRLGIWGDYDYATHGIRLYEGLQGPHAAVVAMHEMTHAIHHRAKLKNRDTKKRFIAVETDGWLRLIRDNPGAWRWLLVAMRAEQAAAGSRRSA